MTGPRPAIGDVVEIALPDGTSAYGRVLKDACVAFYRERGTAGQQPPIGSRDFEFVVGVYDAALRRWPVVGHDPSATDDEDWPPPSQIEDVISGEHRIYDRGETRPAIAMSGKDSNARPCGMNVMWWIGFSATVAGSPEAAVGSGAIPEHWPRRERLA